MLQGLLTLMSVLRADARPASPHGSSVSAASTGLSNRANIATSFAAASDLGSMIDEEQPELPPPEVRELNGQPRAGESLET